MILGAILLAGALGYVLYIQSSDAQLKSENFIIDLHNDSRRGGLRSDRIETRTAEEIHAERRSIAWWPAGLGALLLGIGWAASGTKRSEAGDPEDKSA